MKYFTDETKKKVVKLHLKNGRTLASLAVEYGASTASVCNWVPSHFRTYILQLQGEI